MKKNLKVVDNFQAFSKKMVLNIESFAKIFGLKKAQTALIVTLKSSTFLEKLHNFFAFQLGGMLSIMLIFWRI